jgi:rhodanese-related sulfurtransferase
VDPARTTIDELLAAARSRIERLDPIGAQAAVRDEGALLVDIRSELQRSRDGAIPGALCHPRNVLEWRMDPSSGHSDPAVGGLDRRVIVVCDEGYQSSLAAATLRQLGFARAADLAGGFQAWRAAGLPVEPAA